MIDNKRIIYVLGVLLMLIGGSSFLYNYVNEKIDVAYEMMNEQLFSNTITTEQEEQKEEKELIEPVATEVINEPEVEEISIRNEKDNKTYSIFENEVKNIKILENIEK